MFKGLTGCFGPSRKNNKDDDDDDKKKMLPSKKSDHGGSTSGSSKKKRYFGSTSGTKNIASTSRGNNDNEEGDYDNHHMLWSKDLERHYLGEYSFAVMQGNSITIEDFSQVETGEFATFVGVYDGHGGAGASSFVSQHLFNHFIEEVLGCTTMSDAVIRRAVDLTEEEFLEGVSEKFPTQPLLATVGTCCLIGVIWKGTLYVANIGDARAVLGTLGPSNTIFAEQMTVEHNASREEIRTELQKAHPDDASIVQFKGGAWRVKGIIQVSRAIGDAYLKKPELAVSSDYPRFHISAPIQRAVLTTVPSMYTRVLEANDQFLVFASDGLWELYSNEEVVNLIHTNPRLGIAKKLINRALKRAAQRRNITFEEIKKLNARNRREYHDDITVVVVFLDHNMTSGGSSQPMPLLSVQGFSDACEPSKFSLLQKKT